jgi:predicted GIY-YIG superfamily endonuclease
MSKQCLHLSALGFAGLIAVSALAQNIADNQKCSLCECVPASAHARCAVASPAWYENGHFDPAKRTRELSKELKLTADQQSQMLNTLESAKSQLEAVRSDQSLSRKVRKCKLALIRQASNDQISALLDKKQNTKLARIRSYAYNFDYSE